jgi:hypothetical protein
LAALVGLVGVRPAAAQPERLTVPADTVVKVRLDDRLSSDQARPGDRFTADLAPDDRSGFPDGTRFEGTVTDVQHATKDQPGVVDLRFRTVVLPGGRALSINGRLASLNDDEVRKTADGRLESRHHGSSGKFDPKWVGYGAGGGAVLGTIFGGSFLKGALLGGLGGAVYGYLNRDKGHGGSYREVDVPSGTEFGIRLADRVSFDASDNYRFHRGDADADRADRYRPDRDGPDRDRPDRVQDTDVPAGERVAGSRDTYRFAETVVRVNGNPVGFGDVRPMSINGTLFVPLAPIARAADLRYSHTTGSEEFTLDARDRTIRGSVGDAGDGAPLSAENWLAAPLMVNGEIYVPTGYLSRMADLHVNWNRPDMRLDIDSRRDDDDR